MGCVHEDLPELELAKAPAMTPPTNPGQQVTGSPRGSAPTHEEQAELECWRTLCDVNSPLLERATIRELAPIVLAFKQLILEREAEHRA